MCTLELRDLSVSLGDFSLPCLNLSIEPGTYTVLLGPTGSGKTVLLETLSGIYRPDSGRILLHGKDITDTAPEKRNIGMVYQDYMLFPHMTVEENMGFGLRQRGVRADVRKAEVAAIAEKLGIAHLLSRYPQTLSGGEQQRAALGRALLMKPEVLLLDEPLSALDTRTREKLRDELRRIHQETGVTILHITHHFEDLYSLAEYAVIMRDGEIVQTGTAEEVLNHPATDFAAEFTGMENLFSGVSRSIDGETAEITIGHIVLSALTSLTGDVRAGIRPEHLILSREKPPEFSGTVLEGRICRIFSAGTYRKVFVDAGIPLSVTAEPQNRGEDFLVPGMPVWITVPGAAVHVYRP